MTDQGRKRRLAFKRCTGNGFCLCLSVLMCVVCLLWIKKALHGCILLHMTIQHVFLA